MPRISPARCRHHVLRLLCLYVAVTLLYTWFISTPKERIALQAMEAAFQPEVTTQTAFHPVLKSIPPNMSSLLQKNALSFINNTCPSLHSSYILTEWTNPQIEDIMLIITLNYRELFSNVAQLETIHRPAFRNIVYCGPDVKAFEKEMLKIGAAYVTYIEWSHSWIYFYECTTLAMRLGAPVKGYLTIGDDILLNTWNIRYLPRDRLWIPYGFDRVSLLLARVSLTPQKYPEWIHWDTWYGKQALVNSLNRFDTIIANNTVGSSLQETEFSRYFMKNYVDNIGRNSCLVGAGDIFYIPQTMKANFTISANIFRHFGTFVELALGAISHGLSKKNDIVYIDGSALWEGRRHQPWKYYDENKLYIHPFKLRTVFKKHDGINFFCDTYLKRYGSFLRGEGYEVKNFQNIKPPL